LNAPLERRDATPVSLLSARRTRTDATMLREMAMKQTDRRLRQELIVAANECDVLAIELAALGY
jgi:hypothetical protein